VIKAKQGGLSFASAGNGTSGHLALEQFRLSTGTTFVHVPYKGGGPALQETIAGQVQALFSIALAATPQVKAGKVRALAITSAKRSPVAPELPTVAESGYPGLEVIGWFGWLAPAKTGKPIVERLNRELVKSLANPEVKDRLLSLATEPVGDKPEEFGNFIRSEYDKWGKVIKAANIQIQ
jgi:tripartite-type tricarboxylate transporter receptor subunit TctC